MVSGSREIDQRSSSYVYDRSPPGLLDNAKSRQISSSVPTLGEGTEGSRALGSLAECLLLGPVG